MAEIEVVGQGGLQPVVLVVESSNRHFGTRRFRFVAGWLGGLAGIALISVFFPTEKHPIDTLADILCCDGCCRVSLSRPKMSISQPQRATILHLSGSTEIDYTRNGHRVPLHMESALNELDHIERHVKLGLPKYLQESAAQREADLVDHKFERDLEGSSDQVKPVASYEDVAAPRKKAVKELATTLQHASLPGAKSSITQAVAEASMMEEGLRRKDKEEEGRIIAPSSRELSRDHLEAEKEAANVGKFEKALSSPKERAAVEKSKPAAAATATAVHRSASPPSKESASSAKPISSSTAEVARRVGDAPGRPSHDRQQEKQSQENKGVTAAATADKSKEKSPRRPAAREHAHAAESRRAAVATKAEPAAPKGSGVDAAEWARLEGIQSRIEKLIGGYTGGASRHSSFFKHFDHEEDAAPAELSGAGRSGSKADEGAVQLAEAEAARDKEAFLNL